MATLTQPLSRYLDRRAGSAKPLDQPKVSVRGTRMNLEDVVAERPEERGKRLHRVVAPPPPFPHSHGCERALVRLDDLIGVQHPVESGQDEPLVTGPLDVGAPAAEQGRRVEVANLGGVGLLRLHAPDQPHAHDTESPSSPAGRKSRQPGVASDEDGAMSVDGGSPVVDPKAVLESITVPERVWTRPEVIARPNPIPAAPGVYGWYFRDVPCSTDTTACVRFGELTLLYVGIAPKAPPANGKPPSRTTVRQRVRYHYTGNAEGSTLRLTLGCLLAERLGIELRRVGSGTRMTFGPGEAVLSNWMGENAFVTWAVTPTPWMAEEHIIANVDLPLNLDQNRHHGFHRELSATRATAKAKARQLPVLK